MSQGSPGNQGFKGLSPYLVKWKRKITFSYLGDNYTERETEKKPHTHIPTNRDHLISQKVSQIMVK